MAATGTLAWGVALEVACQALTEVAVEVVLVHGVAWVWLEVGPGDVACEAGWVVAAAAVGCAGAWQPAPVFCNHRGSRIRGIEGWLAR